MAFKFERTEIEDVIVVTPQIFGDDRGFFSETYKKSVFVENGIKDEFNQDNHSKSTKGVLRGLHYQMHPKAQAKLVRCVKGKIFDVAVDIRKGSKTFGKWIGKILSEENKQMLYITERYENDLVVMSEEADFLYKCSN